MVENIKKIVPAVPIRRRKSGYSFYRRKENQTAMNFVKRIWGDICKGENVDLYLIIVVSITVGVIGLLGIAKEKIAPLTLVVLALLAFAGLKGRYLFEELAEKLKRKTAGEISLDEVFLQSPPVSQERLRKAKSIYHNGISLVGTSNSLLGVFSSCLANGGIIRLLLVDHENPCLEVAAQRFQKHQDYEMLKREVEHALDNFKSLLASNESNLHINLFSAVPAYSIWVVDAGTPNAEIWVDLYSFRDEFEPRLHLLPQKDKEMFEFFSRQFELMWQSSKKWAV